ncbi:hypothetical protein Tco_0190688 [Tanacetum coccineum]
MASEGGLALKEKKGVPPVLRISAFMRDHGHPKLAKKLNDKIPKIVDEMFKRVRAFTSGEVLLGQHKWSVLLKGPKEANKGSRDLRKIGSPSEGHSPKQPVEWELGKERGNISSPRNNRSSSNYGKGRMKSVLMEFAIIKCRSPYNIVIGRTRMRSLRVVGSTIHSMIKFPTNQGVVTMETGRKALQECKHLERGRENAEEAFTISHEILDQYVTIGTMLTTSCKQLLADVLRENREEDEELASLMGYSYKCFLRLPKEYIQIKMAEDDEEKILFHMEEGVYCFTHMLKELKNSAATLQRMMEKVLANQRGRNVETYLEEIIIKSKSELGLVQDVKEILRKLKRVNIKIDPAMSSFGVKGRRFLGYMVTEEGLREDPGRIQAIILSPTPISPNQIRSLFLQLTAIIKFILKLAELKHPIREARTRMETTNKSDWTNEAEEAL